MQLYLLSFVSVALDYICSLTIIFVQSRSCSTARVYATCSYQTMSCWRFLPWLDHWFIWSSWISVAMVSCPQLHECHHLFTYLLP